LERLDYLINEKRAEMYEYIKLYGLKDVRTLKKSQELDKLIAIKNRRK